MICIQLNKILIKKWINYKKHSIRNTTDEMFIRKESLSCCPFNLNRKTKTMASQVHISSYLF